MRMPYPSVTQEFAVDVLLHMEMLLVQLNGIYIPLILMILIFFQFLTQIFYDIFLSFSCRASRLGREHHDDLAQFMLGMGYATEALHLPGISKRSARLRLVC